MSDSEVNMLSDVSSADVTLFKNTSEEIPPSSEVGCDPVFGQQLSTVVPKSFQWSIINSFHTALKHPGWEKTLQKIRETYWFDKMSSTVRRFVDNCVICRTSKGRSGAIQAQLHPIQKPIAAFQVIHMDIHNRKAGYSR